MSPCHPGSKFVTLSTKGLLLGTAYSTDLKPKDQLHSWSFQQSGVVGMVHEVHVQQTQEGQQC